MKESHGVPVEDRLVTFLDASRLMRTYSPCVRSAATLRQWHRHGVGREDGTRVHLRAVNIGSYKHTKIRWINELLESLEMQGETA